MAAQKQSVKQDKPWYKKWWGVALIVVVALSAVSALVETDKPSTKESPQQAPTQSGVSFINPEKKITGTETVGGKYVVVTGYLLNNTDKVGMADCNVEFYDREMQWAGGKGLGGQNLEPGQRYDFTVQVEVEHTGLIDKQGINCEQ